MNPEDAISSQHSVDSLGKSQEIERQWTQLLLDWVKVCGHAHTTLDNVDFMDVVRMYGEDLFVVCQPQPEALDRFLEERFPKLDIKSSDMMRKSRNLYIVATVLLYHCITNGPVNAVINICLYLTLDQQTLVQKFCEQLEGVEITVSTVDAAIAGAFEKTIAFDNYDPNEELQNIVDCDPIEISEIKTETSEPADSSEKADFIDTLFFKSPFEIKSSVLEYPDKISSETKKITDRPLSVTVGSDNTKVIDRGSVMVSTKICNTQEGRKKEESKPLVRELLKELDIEPIKLQASDLNATFRKTCTGKKANTEVTVNNSPKEKIDTLFLKSSFTVKSSTSVCPRNSQSEMKSGITLRSTLPSKENNSILLKECTKIETIPEYLKKLDHELIKAKNCDLNTPSHDVHTFAEDEIAPVTNDPLTTTEALVTNKPTKITEAPVNNGPTETIDTLYFKSPFSNKSSAFEYTGKTEPVTKSVTIITFTTTESKNITKGRSNMSSRIEFPTKKRNKKNYNQDNTISNSPASLQPSANLKPKKCQDGDLKSKLCVIKDEWEKMKKKESVIFTKPVIEQEQITEDPAKAVDTLYLKSPFSIKSSTFGCSGNTSSETKNYTNMSLLSIASTSGIRSGEAPIKVNTNKDISRKTVNKPEIYSDLLKKRDLEPKKPEASTLEATLGKVHTFPGNSDNPKINMCRSHCKSVTFQQLDPKPEAPVACSPTNVSYIDTLFMKFPFTIKSSLSGYLNKVRADTKTETEKALPSTNQTASILKSSFITTMEDIAEDNKSNEIAETSEIRGSGNRSNVIKEPKKPSNVLIVEVANTVSQKFPFTSKSAMKYPSTSSGKKSVRVRDQRVDAGSTRYVSNIISEISGQLNIFRNTVKKTKGVESRSNSFESDSERPRKYRERNVKGFGEVSAKQLWLIILVAVAIIVTLSIVIPYVVFIKDGSSKLGHYPQVDIALRRYNILDKEEKNTILINMNMNPSNTLLSWNCQNGLCQKVNQPRLTGSYKSHSRCTLLCAGPQLWPHPIGHKHFGNKIVALDMNGIQYSRNFVPSEDVKKYLHGAFTLFKMDLVRLEVTESKAKHPQDLAVKGLHIEFDVESDPDPRLRLDTEESYTLTIKTTDVIHVKIKSPSFCGVRHGLETLSQLILLDQSTGYLITLIHANIKDAPSYKYRGLMIDTARNYITVRDLSRTIDAMAMCKLNTFHWRISDSASFPMVIPEYPQLFEYGAYGRNMVYTAEDIKFLVERAEFRGIRILIEVAAPGPIGRAWSWTTDAYSPPAKEKTSSASDVLCLRLKMHESTFDVLEAIYTYIIRLTKVHDVFHLSNGLFSFVNCFGLIEDREHFLDRALHRLRTANNGSLPRLPLIWYDRNLMSRSGWSWHHFGVQLHDTDLPETVLNKYRLIQSSRWDLSCEMNKHRCVRYRTWQQMYNWRTWRDLDVLTIEGGEAVLWTDLVDGNNLDSHLWPRTAAVAERLWSDAMANQSASAYEYLRLDAQRWRMLIRGIKAQTVWPMWCTFNPGQCFNKIKT